MTNKQLKSLELHRRQIKASITRFGEHLISLKNKQEINVTSLQRRINEFEPLLHEFNEIKSAMEGLDESEFDSDVRQKVEDVYDDLIDRTRKIVAANQEHNLDSAIVPTIVANPDRVQLQIGLLKMDLPRFSGKYAQWFPFFNTFQSLVHDNIDIGKI